MVLKKHFVLMIFVVCVFLAFTNIVNNEIWRYINAILIVIIFIIIKSYFKREEKSGKTNKFYKYANFTRGCA